MRVISRWDSKEPDPGIKKRVGQTLHRCLDMDIPPLTDLPNEPQINNNRFAYHNSRLFYQRAVASRKKEIDAFLAGIEKKLKSLKNSPDAVQAEFDADRAAADEVLEASCKSITAVLYPAPGEREFADC